MNKKIPKSQWPTDEELRHQMFYFWCGLFIIYIATFLLSSMKTRVGWPQASDAAWRVAYLIVPVLSAFGSYWFGANEPQKERRIDPRRRRVMFVLTGILHAAVLLWIVFGVLTVDFADQEKPKSYVEAVDDVIKTLLLVWSASLIPVGWLLKGVEVPDKPASPPKG